MGDHRLNAKETFYLNVYRLQRMDAKGSRARVAFALLSALATCCSVMYITADGDAETVLAARGYTPRANKFIGSGYDIRRPRSIESVDVKKAGMIVTNTPDGRMRLLKYLNKVEKQIAKESAGRRADIAAIRAKMAVNARRAKAALDRNMRRVQAKFAAQAELANKRNRATIRRSRKTREIMRKNKRAAARSLNCRAQPAACSCRSRFGHQRQDQADQQPHRCQCCPDQGLPQLREQQDPCHRCVHCGPVPQGLCSHGQGPSPRRHDAQGCLLPHGCRPERQEGPPGQALRQDCEGHL